MNGKLTAWPILALAALVFLLASLEPTVLGPGILAPADPGVLERVAGRRLANGWALTRDPARYEVLAAVAD